MDTIAAVVIYNTAEQAGVPGKSCCTYGDQQVEVPFKREKYCAAGVYKKQTVLATATGTTGPRGGEGADRAEWPVSATKKVMIFCRK